MLSKSLRRGIIATTLLTATGLQAGTISVDGILSPGDDYTTTYSLDYSVDGIPVTGHLSVGVGSNSDGVTGGNDDIFLLWELPTELQDLTFGANATPGWGKKRDKAQYKGIQGSEYLGFDLAIGSSSEEVKIKMKDADNDGVGPGYSIERDADGALLAASTSLDHNIALFGDTYIIDSPECGTVRGAPTDDADCYANHDAAGYEFAHIYEMQFNGSLFSLADVADFIGLISNSEGHASPPKNGAEVINPPCIENNDCQPVDVPTPTIPVLMALMLSGLMLRRLRQ